MIKISVIADILVLQFYEYIGYILIVILTQNIGDIKINENLKILRKTLKNYIRSKNRYFKFNFF